MSSMFTMEMFEDEIVVYNWRCRYFVCTIDGHYKYYIVDLDTFIAKYGRIWAEPTSFQHRNKFMVSVKIGQKLSKGYREITSVEELKSFYLDKIN